MQFRELQKSIDQLQSRYGDPNLRAVYGTGCTARPRAMFVFMNPTGKNVSTHHRWQGLRAPWLGTKNVWQIFRDLDLLPQSLYAKTQTLRPEDWSSAFAVELYDELRRRKVYVTNLAKCTQADARPLSDRIFREYRQLMLQEIALARPEHVILFGNQVSATLLEKPISVSQYRGTKAEILAVGRRRVYVYPTYYPVGQGRRNLPLAIRRITAILS